MQVEKSKDIDQLENQSFCLKHVKPDSFIFLFSTFYLPLWLDQACVIKNKKNRSPSSRANSHLAISQSKPPSQIRLEKVERGFIVNLI